MTAAIVAASLRSEPWFFYHVVAMSVGQCLTAFFAVWTVHHDCEKEGVFARTIRGALKSRATWHMFYHLEHHLFPSVPTRHLPVLADRIDKVGPDVAQKRVL